jgi:predicted transcriptional regulator
MNKQHIHIGVEDAGRAYKHFIDTWHKAETGTIDQAEIHLNFESFSMLASVLTPKRLELMKVLRQKGLLSIRALSKQLGRDYKNVHTDVIALEAADLIQRSEDGLLVVPWDVIDAHVRLVA